MSSLPFGMFTPRRLVNTKAVDFQGFQSEPSSVPDIAIEGNPPCAGESESC